jgi:flagellar motor protein MotB
MFGTIGRQTASYRQGLVLGLTMAEIMLLLVFCLLIAVGVVLANERNKRDEAVLLLKKVEAIAAADEAFISTIRKNARLAELVDRSARSASQRDIDEFWRKLVESNDIVSSIERQGVARSSLTEESNSLAKIAQLLKEGIDPEKVARGAALTSAIDAAIADKTVAKLTPQEIAALVQKGIAASKPVEEKPKGHDWPPIIKLSEAGGYFFAAGSAELRLDFETALRTVVVHRLLQIAESFDVDVIEVIGHTDEQPVSSRTSNLDRRLGSVTSGESEASALQWSDNAGLGLARALAVVKVLSADARLGSFRILPLSGAQLIDTEGRLTKWDGQGDVRERRRIEIRMRKSG